MSSRVLVSVVAAVLAITIYTVCADRFFDSCGLAVEDVRQAVIADLQRRQLSGEHLSPAEPLRGSCAFSFAFEGQDQKLDYVVSSTWLHGIELSVWDYKRDQR